MGYVEFFKMLEAWGLLDIVLPFFLITTIIYALLQRTKVLGKRKFIDMTVSASSAGLVVIGHVIGAFPREWDVVLVLNAAVPHLAIVFVAAFCVLFILAITGIEEKQNINFDFSFLSLTFSVIYVYFAFPEIFGMYIFLAVLIGIQGGLFNPAKTPIALFVLLYVLFIFHAATGFPKSLPSWLQWLHNTTFQMVMFVVFILLISVKLVTDKVKPIKDPVVHHMKTKTEDPYKERYEKLKAEEKEKEKKQKEAEKKSAVEAHAVEPEHPPNYPRPNPMVPPSNVPHHAHPEYAGRPEAHNPRNFEFG